MISNFSLNNNFSFDNDNLDDNLDKSINYPYGISNSYLPIPNEFDILFNDENMNNTNIKTQMTPNNVNIIKPDNFIKENNLRVDEILLNKKRKIGRRSNEEKLITNNNNEKYHDKYTNDNILRKVKHLLIESCFIFVNDIFKNTFKSNISKKTPKYENLLIKIDHKLIKEVKIDINRDISKQTIKWILTYDKCPKFTNYDDDHNEKLIEKCLNECNEENRKKLELLLNLTFSDFLDFYCGKTTEYNNILVGLITFDQYCESDYFKKKNPDFEEYKECLKDYLYNYEDKLNSTKERKPRKLRNNILFENNKAKQNGTSLQYKDI